MPRTTSQVVLRLSEAVDRELSLLGLYAQLLRYVLAQEEERARGRRGDPGRGRAPGEGGVGSGPGGRFSQNLLQP